jgi:predicted negative regulator of RcsB-dependent stress response
MDALIVVLVMVVVALAFYFGLRAYTRRQASQSKKSADFD